jgi:hypothetical protein
MKLLLILSLLCINNATPSPAKGKKTCTAKKEVKKTSFNLAPSILIVY